MNNHPADCPCCTSAPLSRRSLLKTLGAAAIGSAAGLSARAADPDESPSFVTFPGVPIIDDHQHCLYNGRPDKNLLLHQHNTGVRTTIILAAGNPGAPGNSSAGNENAAAFVKKHPERYVYFTSTNTARRDTAVVLEYWLRAGALGVGELKNQVACDSPGNIRAAEVAREFDVPVLLHFQEDDPKQGKGFNIGYERFHTVLERFPTVKFIGHAQTFWAHVDKNYDPARGLYPRGPVAPGGLTDRWLSDYPNYYGDLSAGSGNGGLARDAAFAADFLVRHQDKLIYGSDCTCLTGVGPGCIAAVKQKLLKQLITSDDVRNKILYGNITKLVRFGAAYPTA
jgi:predicted TIM-barrel fold metal-dependent hydrolase